MDKKPSWRILTRSFRGRPPFSQHSLWTGSRSYRHPRQTLGDSVTYWLLPQKEVINLCAPREKGPGSEGSISASLWELSRSQAVPFQLIDFKNIYSILLCFPVEEAGMRSDLLVVTSRVRSPRQQNQGYLDSCGSTGSLGWTWEKQHFPHTTFSFSMFGAPAY